MSRKTANAVAEARKQYKKAQKQAAKASKKQAKLQRKAEKKAIVSVHKRPIVCPPDQAGRSLPFRLLGYLCRVLTVWMAAAGLVTFVSAAFAFNVPTSTIFLTTFVVVGLCALAMYNRWGLIASSVSAGGILVYVTVSNPYIFLDLGDAVLNMYNGIIRRLNEAYDQVYKNFLLDVYESDELMSLGVCLICVLVGLVFSFSLIKRVRIIPPAILATTFLVIILTFNIYSNKNASNLGIALVIVSFATVLVMAAYDRLYRVKDDKHYDTGMNLFGDHGRPSYPPEYVAAQEQKALEKAARKATSKTTQNTLARIKGREEVTVDDELTQYFGGRKKKTPKSPKSQTTLSPAERKEQKAKAREIRRQVRLVKNYDRVTTQSRAAMGGYASAAAMLLAFLIIALPALTITGNFETIDIIDDKLSFARDYVTAVLRGDDKRLDELDYEADRNNFVPRSTDLEQLKFQRTQIFFVESRYNAPYYLRGWIGTDYADGAWQAVNDETLDAYRSIFDTSRSPGEEFRYNFYHYMKPSLVDDPQYTENYLGAYQSNKPYGFVTALVSLRRVNSPSSMTYFPSVFKVSEGVFDYGTTDLSELTYINYFDGIYTGRAFEKNSASQATVAMTPDMKSEYWSTNQAELIAAFNIQKEALLINEYLNKGGNLQMYPEKDEKTGLYLFSYQYNVGRKDEKIWRSYHLDSPAYDLYEVDVENASEWIVKTPYGTLCIKHSGRKILSVQFIDTTQEGLCQQYFSSMTDADRQLLMTYLKEYSDYSDFVYNTYLGTSGSEYLKELAQTIKDSAEGDISVASQRNSSYREVYVQRDLLVRSVIDYIISEKGLGCAYTITPDISTVDPTLDGVENFLKNTKEGYCVQFASSAALLLREMGIPVRYVEGYIAADMKRQGDISVDMTYGGYVRDEDAHAWIEVYYDGVGWIAYETTPEYYDRFYPIKADNPIVKPPETETPEPETQRPPEPETQPPEDESGETDTTETDTLESGMDLPPDDDSQAIMQGTLIALGVLAGIALIAGIIGAIVSSARRAEEQRQMVVSQVLDDHFGTNVNEEDRHEMACSMMDSINTLLRLFELTPLPGEFRDAYADRLTAILTAADEKGKKREEDRVELPDLRRVMEAMSAEEFGYGMTIREMKLLAIFYLCLRREVKRRLPASARFRLRYIKHLI
ncbi:MAG: transglutaminase domain-containing protein [Ruminococcaceae bacterium]|nr:transglutaminase domain-containing protein [Oscillospiraceae bacterium]